MPVRMVQNFRLGKKTKLGKLGADIALHWFI
jgi:hypothetical protein